METLIGNTTVTTPDTVIDLLAVQEAPKAAAPKPTPIKVVELTKREQRKADKAIIRTQKKG